MICLHRIRGEELWVNPDLIVFVEATGHDTIITLADANHVLVQETPADVSAAVLRFRSTVIAAADELGELFVVPPAADGEGRVLPFKPARDERMEG
jgi:uncharacterized protein YlzI (FlbEa/FlbD family)